MGANHAILSPSGFESLLSPLDGVFVGIITREDGVHCAVVLLRDIPGSPMNWAKAKEWAASVGGCLPSRPVAALLFSLAKEQFQPRWYWTSDELEGSYAWCQHFGCGGQDSHRNKNRARAVRMIPLEGCGIAPVQEAPTPQTRGQVQAAFVADIQAVLNKWGAELEAKDHYQGYPECGEDVRMTVTIPAVYHALETVREWTEIDLGPYRKAEGA